MIDDVTRTFLKRVFNALLRILVLAVFSAIHWLVERGTDLIVPSGYGAYKDLLNSINYIFFAILYFYLLWDMLRVFLPGLLESSNPEPEKHTAR